MRSHRFTQRQNALARAIQGKPKGRMVIQWNGCPLHEWPQQGPSNPCMWYAYYRLPRIVRSVPRHRLEDLFSDKKPEIIGYRPIAIRGDCRVGRGHTMRQAIRDLLR